MDSWTHVWNESEDRHLSNDVKQHPNILCDMMVLEGNTPKMGLVQICESSSCNKDVILLSLAYTRNGKSLRFYKSASELPIKSAVLNISSFRQWVFGSRPTSFYRWRQPGRSLVAVVGPKSGGIAYILTGDFEGKWLLQKAMNNGPVEMTWVFPAIKWWIFNNSSFLSTFTISGISNRLFQYYPRLL